MTIQWSEPALNDLQAIKDYISRDSKIYALNFIERLITLIEKLSQFPDLGRAVPEANSPDIKELDFQNYRIIYRLEVKEIQILAVVHAARLLSGFKTKPWEKK